MIEKMLQQLTLEEKCSMLHGRGIWEVAGSERLGIPEWTLSDGPMGVRGRGIGMGTEMAKGLMMPAPIAMAASWDVELLAESGTAIGLEAQDRKVQVLLAPTVNLHRVPTSGRSFECYSEDPHLTSRMAVSFIQAVQAQGVGACIKHFAANEQETDRFISDSIVDERTLRELYFAPFEAAVKEANVRAVMGSYNLLNGTQACANRWLLEDILRDEWGFEGFVVTDWSALHSAKEPALAGTDLEMPAGGYWSGGQLLKLAESGEVPEAAIDRKVANVMRFLEWAGRLEGETDHAEKVVEHPGHAELARKAAAAGTVLVHNRKGLLPLIPDADANLSNGNASPNNAPADGGPGIASPNNAPAADGPNTASPNNASATGGPGTASPSNAPAADSPGTASPDKASAAGGRPPKSIALLGPNSLRPCPGGGGSAELGLRESPDLPTALRERLGKSVTVTHHPCFSLDRDAPPLPESWLGSEGATLEFYEGRSISGKPALTQTDAPVPMMYFGGNWPVKSSYFLAVRQRLVITPDASGPWRFCGAGFSDVLLYADGELVSDNRENSFSLGPGLKGGEGIVQLEAGKPVDLMLEHTSERQHQRFILSDIRAAPLRPAEEEEAEIAAGIQAAAEADAVVVVVGSTAHWETEGADRPNLSLPLRQDELVRRAIEANPSTAIVVNSGAPMLMPWLDDAAAVLVNWYPGQEGAAALADVLVGLAEPSGRMPVTWPSSFEDTPAGANIPRTHPGEEGKVFYDEGVLIGHRWLDAHDIEPTVCFGHGGSYTSFEWTTPEVTGEFPTSEDSKGLTAKIAVRNTGTRPGSEVVQCYLSRSDAHQAAHQAAQNAASEAAGEIANNAESQTATMHPPQWLAGFAKLHLDPGETATAEIPLNFRSFAHWNTDKQDWNIAPGAYEIRLSRSSREAVFTLPARSN